MATYEFFHVDAFTDRLFGGNPACVFPDARGLSDDAMRALAREMGCAASAFVLPATRAECTHRVRFFKPHGDELPTCGHGTVATFAVLAARGAASDRAVMECAAGDLPIAIALDASGVRVTMVQGAGRFAPSAAPEGASASVGLARERVASAAPVELASTGGPWLAIVPLRTVDDVAACAPAAASIRALGATRVYAFAMASDGARTRAHARYFFLDGDTVEEDPVTGTAAGALTAWLERHGALARETLLTIEQGIECRRPGTIVTRVEADGRVAITGGAVVAFVSKLDV